MSNFNFNSGKLTCSRQQSHENDYLPELYFNTYVLPTVKFKPPSPEVKIWHCVFSIFYISSREIKLSIFIAKFIRPISTKNHTIMILRGNFAPFIQYTVMLPECYPIVTEINIYICIYIYIYIYMGSCLIVLYVIVKVPRRNTMGSHVVYDIGSCVQIFNREEINTF